MGIRFPAVRDLILVNKQWLPNAQNVMFGQQDELWMKTYENKLFWLWTKTSEKSL